jgi:WD40 repeat protein
MKMVKRFLFSSAALLIASCIPFSNPAFASGSADNGNTVVINSGHKGAIFAMEYDGNTHMLFTGGEDGRVRAWDLASRRLVRSLRIGHDAVSMLAVHPALPQFAVVKTEGQKARFLAVWDWREGKELFSVPLPDEPLFLRYSAAAGYIVVGLSRWDSLKIYGSADGSPFRFHPEGFGIVSFAEISRTEKTIMTYQPGGRIAYWDMGTGGLIKELKGVPQLSKPEITRDRSCLLGVAGKEVLLVDLVSGAVRTRIPAAEAISADISTIGDEIAWISGTGGSGVSIMTLTNDPPTVRSVSALSASLLRYAGGELFVSGAGGEIHSIAEGEDIRLLGKNELANVSGMAFGRHGLALANDRWIWFFKADDAQGKPAAQQPVIVGNPLAAPSGLAFVDDGRLLVWSKSSDKGAYGILDTATGSFEPGFSGFTGPLLQAIVQDDRLLTLEKGGMVRIVDLATGVLRFSVWSPGAVRICPVSQTRLVAGRSVSGRNEGSIMFIDTATGETVAIRGRSVYTYEFAFDASAKTLYSLGVDAEGETNLLALSGAEWGNELRIAGYAGEDLSASLALDAAKGTLYSSLGFEGITVLEKSNLFSLPSTIDTPRQIAVNAGLLAALNEDSSVSIKDLAAGGQSFGIYVFDNGGWCIVFPGGTYAVSDSVAGLVTVYQKGEPILDDIYRVTLNEGP